MTESMPIFERVDNPEDADNAVDVAEAFEPIDPVDPEEPETLIDEFGAGETDPGEADPVDVAEQEDPVDDDEDGYDRNE